MHAVTQIDVPPPRRPEHHRIALRHPLGTVAGEVVHAEIGFRLEDDVPRYAAVGRPHREEGAQQVAGDAIRGTVEERAGEGL